MYDSTIILSFIVLCCTVYYWLTRNKYFEENDIIHVKPLPFFGNAAPRIFQISSTVDYLQKFYDLNKEAKYVGFYYMDKPMIFIRDPELIKTITVKNFDHFVDHRGFINPESDYLYGSNLFALRGDTWRKMRCLLSPSFTSSKLKGMSKLMLECAENVADYLTKQAETEPYAIDSKDIFSRYTNDVIATCAFGVAVDSLRNPNNEFYIFGKRATSLTGLKFLKYFAAKLFPGLSKFLSMKLIDTDVETFFNELIRNTVERRDKEGIVRPDMIHLMMESRNNEENGRTNLTIQEMTSQAFIFFFAGFETTSLIMCFLAHVIATHPEVQRKLQDEIDEVYGKCKGDVTYEAINSLQYLDAVINETMRLYPVAAVLDRVCTKEFELPPALPGKKPVLLKPGHYVYLALYAVQRDSKYFSNPAKFYPERFIEDPQGTLHSPAFLPFGSGPRTCIGNRFALVEMKVLFFYLLAKCSLLPSEKMIVPIEFSSRALNLTAKGGFYVTLQLRNKSGMRDCKVQD